MRYTSIILVVLSLIALGCKNNPTDPDPIKYGEVQIKPYIILNGEKNYEFHNLELLTELLGKSYNFYPVSQKWIIKDVEYGEYPIHMVWADYEAQDTLTIDSSYVEIKFGNEFFESLEIQIYEVGNSDTVRFKNGGITINYEDYKRMNSNGSAYLWRTQMNEVVTIGIHSPNFETIYQDVTIDGDNPIVLYIQPDVLQNIKGQVILNDGRNQYQLSDVQVMLNGNSYKTNKEGEFVLTEVESGLQTFRIEEENLDKFEEEVNLFSGSKLTFKVQSDNVDFFPLKVGNKWTYKIIDQWSDAGAPDSKLDVTSEWEIISETILSDDTSYTVRDIRNGMEIKNWMSDTTYIENEENEFTILLKESGKIEFIDNQGMGNDVYDDYYTFYKRYPAYFEEIPYRQCGRPEGCNGAILKKGIGMVYFDGNSYQTTNSPRRYTVSLIDYSINQ